MRDLFGAGVASLEVTRGSYVETSASVDDYCELDRQTFGPMIAIRSSLADQPERLAALDRGFNAFVRRHRRTGGRVEIPYEYLLVVGHPARPAGHLADQE